MATDVETVNLTRLQNTKTALTNFREVLAALSDVLLWKKEWFPAVVVGVVTVFYAVIWWNEVTVLTTAAVLAMVLVGVDVACSHGRKFISGVFPWTPQREREFTDICLFVSQGGVSLSGLGRKLAECRAGSPLVYYFSTGTALLVTAWIGNLVPNLLLCYWATLVLALYPGLKKSGLVEKYGAPILSQIREQVAKYMPKKKPTDAPKED